MPLGLKPFSSETDHGRKPFFVIFTGSIARCAKRRYLSSKADFKVFRPAGATRCTDGGEIWHGGGEHAKFHPIGATVRVQDPQNSNFY